MNTDLDIYREFTYPLNVFMLILTAEEGSVRYLHYGFFESDDETITEAQERSTRMLVDRLGPPPLRILDVGVGLATTLRRLTEAGYDAEGITPDAQQIEMIRRRHGDAVRVTCSSFELFEAAAPYDELLFQESSQYIDAGALFSRASTLASRVLVIDEFSLVSGLTDALPALEEFNAKATLHGFRLSEEVDVSGMAKPTVAWFMKRIPGYRDRLVAELGVTGEQIEALLESGERYLARYASGEYGYRVLRYERPA